MTGSALTDGADGCLTVRMRAVEFEWFAVYGAVKWLDRVLYHLVVLAVLQLGSRHQRVVARHAHLLVHVTALRTEPFVAIETLALHATAALAAVTRLVAGQGTSLDVVLQGHHEDVGFHGGDTAGGYDTLELTKRTQEALSILDVTLFKTAFQASKAKAV